MKKGILFIIVNIFLLADVFAYKLETIKEYPFDDFFQYYETWDEEFGCRPGLAYMMKNSKMTVMVEYSNDMFFIEDNTECQKKWSKSQIHCSVNDNIYIRFGQSIYMYKNSTDLAKPDYQLTFDEGTNICEGLIYSTGNRVYAQVGKGAMVSWELKGEGKSEYRNAGETEEELRGGIREELGIEYDDDGSEIYFGETTISKNRYPNSRKIWKSQTFKTPGYENYKNLNNFDYIGTTKNGTAILYDCSVYYTTYKPEDPIKLKIAVLDPWTREVNVIELEPGCWNPPRDEKRGLIPAMSQCIDEEGNVYFTDCNKEKGCYEIKKLSNEWLKEYEFSKRATGRMKENHIELQKYPGEEEAGFNGYNYEHEYLWILSKTGDWLKVRKVDGREGWVNINKVSVNEGTDLSVLELTKKELKELNAQKKKELNQKK